MFISNPPNPDPNPDPHPNPDSHPHPRPDRTPCPVLALPCDEGAGDEGGLRSKTGEHHRFSQRASSSGGDYEGLAITLTLTSGRRL